MGNAPTGTVKRRRSVASLPAARTFHKPTAQPETLDEPDPEGIEADAAADDAGLDALAAQRRYQMISEAAYFLAERRGFQDGYDLDDWLRAESEIDQQPR